VNPRRLAGPAARVALLLVGSAIVAHAQAATGTRIGAAASGTGRPADARPAPARPARPALPPLTLDSLATDHIPRGFIAARDVNSLTRLRHEVETAANQFRRYIGEFPPPIRIAAVGDIDPARLRASGDIDFVVTDWPEPSKPGQPPSGASITERIARWDLEAWERAKGTGTPPEGRSRLTPDWFASAIGGLATPPAEQTRRLTWMRAHLDQRIPIPQLLPMTRPTEGAAAQAALDTHPGPSPPIRVLVPSNGAVRMKPSHRTERRAGAAAAAAEEKAQLFDDESLSFATFLAAREDERFLGLWYEIVLKGQPQSAAFNIAKTMLSSPEVLEKEWLSWLKETDPKSGQ